MKKALIILSALFIFSCEDNTCQVDQEYIDELVISAERLRQEVINAPNTDLREISERGLNNLLEEIEREQSKCD